MSNYKETTRIKIKPGTQANMTLACPRELTLAEINGIISKDATLIVNCVIIYKDVRRIERSTVVYRRYNPVTKMFDKLPADFPYADQDYEG